MAIDKIVSKFISYFDISPQKRKYLNMLAPKISYSILPKSDTLHVSAKTHNSLRIELIGSPALKSRSIILIEADYTGIVMSLLNMT